MLGGFLQGDTDTMAASANVGNTTVTDIQAAHQALQSTVNGMPAAWVGNAPPVFFSSFDDWTQGVTRLLAALTHMNHATNVSAASYGQANVDGAHAVGAAANASPLLGALGLH